MPNIRKKQNHCLHMSGDCPPLVCLLRPMIANLCKTIPVAKEEGALERNILVRAQNTRQAFLGRAFYSYSPPIRSLNDSRNHYIDPAPTQHSAQTNGPGLQLFICCQRLRQPFRKQQQTITKVNKQKPRKTQL